MMSDMPRDPHSIDAELDANNPYRSMPSADASSGDAKPRTGGLTTICIIAAILGGFGLMSALSGMAGLAMSSTMQANLESQLEEGTGDPAADSALQMQLDMQELTKDYLWFQVFSVLALVIIGPALLIGAILSLQRKAVGRKLLIAAMLAAALFEVCRAVPATMMQLKMGEAVQGMMREIGDQALAEAGEDVPDIGEFTDTMGSAIAIAGLVFGLGWTLIKLVFYLVGWSYLRKPAVAAQFASQSQLL